MLVVYMRVFYLRLIISGIIFSTTPIVCNAGILNNLFGFGNFEDCIEGGLKKASTSREIKKTYDDCNRQYPDQGTVQKFKKEITRLPLVPIPRPPVVLTPLVPVVPIPIN